MRIERLLIVGAGGHAKVVADAALLSGCTPEALVIGDDSVSEPARRLLGMPVLNPAIPTVMCSGEEFHVAVGHAAARAELWSKAEKAGLIPRTVQHPRAILSARAVLGPGCFLAANAVVAADAQVGRGVILNHAAVVDHDCVVGDFTHIAPGATLSGGARIGHGTMIGTGARILPGVRIGNGVVVGAGAVVTRDLPDGCRAVGVPAYVVGGLEQ